MIRPPEKDFFTKILKMSQSMPIEILEYPQLSQDLEAKKESLNTYMKTNFDLILDAIFGFSFKPPIKSPFDVIIDSISQSKLPVFSIDIPSGWDVEQG